MNHLPIARAVGLNLLLLGLLWAQGARQQPDLSTRASEPVAVLDTPLTGYEVAILTAEFAVHLERGLSEAFQKPIHPTASGKARLSGKHPAWVQPALRELKVRGAIPPRFSAGNPMPRYQVGQMLAQYIQRLEACLREQQGAPRGVRRFRTQPTIRLKRTHPAYRSLQYLAQGNWVRADAPLYQNPTEPIQGKELPDMLRDVAQRVLERYRDEPHREH